MNTFVAAANFFNTDSTDGYNVLRTGAGDAVARRGGGGYNK